MTITLLLIILILLVWLYIFRQRWRNAKDYAERWKGMAIKWDEEKLDEIRKLNARNLELQSELEESERRNSLLRQMNGKLSGRQRAATEEETIPPSLRATSLYTREASRKEET